MGMATQLLEPGRIDIEAIKDQHPLAQTVEQYVTLRRKAGKLEGLCPFHDERTPSFKIYEKDERYHCYGCGAHGDVFDFLHHMEGLDLRGAAERLTGGTFPTYTQDRIEELRAKRAAFEAAEAERKNAAVLSARERWIAADPNFSEHEYLTRKGIKPCGTRLEGNKLLIPLMGEDGKIQTLQSIDPTGRKMFVSDAPVSGGLFVVGGKVASAEQPVLICEGFATAASLHQATGYVVVCAFNSGNLTKVADRLHQRYPDKQYLVAGDDDRSKAHNVGREAALQAAAVLGCEVIFPAFAEGSTGTDFNDMAAESGLKTVREFVIEGALPEGVSERDGAIKTVDAFDFDESAIPVRPWIVPGVMLARHTHMLVAPGSSGKSLFTLQMAIMLATGQQWGDMKPKRRCRTLVINVEDDIDEQRRRLAAARSIMNPDAALLKGMIHLAEEPETIVVAKVDPAKKSVVTAPIVADLCRYIRRNKIDVLIVDPFAETFEGDENSNSEVKWAMKVWRDDIARATGCAVYLVHHTVKYASGGAGNADVIRGAGAIVNSTRISSTLFTMTEEEAKALGIPADERNMYVRFDDAKVNQSLKKEARWFEKVSVTLSNGNGFDDPDQVGALRPWAPPNAFAGCSEREIYNALLMIDRGLEDVEGRMTGERFTHRTNSKEGTDGKRWAGHPVMAALGVNEERAKLIIKEWIKNGMLVEDEYEDPVQRKVRRGLIVSKDHMQGLQA